MFLRVSARLSTRVLAVLSTFCAAVVVAAVHPPAAGAAGRVGASQATLVNTVPAGYTPNIDNGTVYAIAQVGSWIVVGGSFTSVTPHESSTAVTRSHVFAFDQATGALDTGFAPTLDGTVDSLAAGPTANTVYVGGAFNTVNGAKSKGLALLNLTDGNPVPGFKPPAMNGVVDDLRLSGGHLWLVGSFTTLAGNSRQGVGTLNPTTGAVDSYVTVALTGHHNYNGSGAKGAVGGRALDISPDGSRAVIVGNFKNANGVVHDQVVMLDLGASSATVDPNWNTADFSGACARNAFDTYVEDVDFAPDGSYFAIATTGGGGISNNPDGSRSLCDSASRWATDATGSNVQPTWVDYTGNDTFWSVAVTGTAIYVGGHERWVNNPSGSDRAAAGAVPRPGMVALDPINGLPYSWNPGRNPRGAGAYALLATSQGLYVGSDTDWIGNFAYKRQKIAYFPLAGGETPPSTSTAALPADAYQAGPMPGGSSSGGSANNLQYRPMTTTSVGSLTTVPNSVSWGSTRGAFVVGSTLFWDGTDGNFYGASFDGSTVGTPRVLDAYDDPYWSNVQTGSRQTYRGVKSTYYGEMPSVTGQFYADGRIFYTLSGKSALYWRYFEPDDGILGGSEYTLTGVDFSNVEGMFRSGSTIYYADRRDGTLHTVPFVNDVPSSGGSTVSTPGVDWRARSLFLYGSASFPNQLPTASATMSCSALSCSFDGTTSSDPDGSVTQWQWSFGDGTTGTGSTVTHGYAGAGADTVTLTVTDNRGGTDTWTGTADPTAPATEVSFTGAADSDAQTANPAVTAPSGIRAGDTELLFASVNAAGITGTPTGLTGWTQIAHITNSTLETTVFARTAQAGDPGTAVTVPLASAAKSDLQLIDYAGVDSASLAAATNSDNTRSTHTTAPVSVTDAGAWVLSYWADRSSGTTSWTTPNSVTRRVTGIGAGGGRVSAVAADSGQPVTTGSYGPLSASVDATSGRANMVTVVLPPAS